MPMELYSADAFARDLVNAISESEGKPLNTGSGFHEGIDREYAFRLISEAKRAINSGQNAPGSDRKSPCDGAKSSTVINPSPA
jgi:hypothetical protein